VTRLLLWLAQGFGLGRIPVAPGTFGSLAGLGWFALLLLTGRFSLFLAGTLAGLLLSIWLCDLGEKALRQKDPGSVVFDEIAAVPACFVGWLLRIVRETGSLPNPGYFLAEHRWLAVLGVFAAFRFFDVLKPWPLRQSQSLPGGWGVTIDDALAAVYVNVVVLVAITLWS
jgi:phosphatidylglycerophosphatase A